MELMSWIKSIVLPNVRLHGFWLISFLLLGYIGYLLGANYLSNMQLHSTAQERFILEVEQQAKSIGYYFSERIRDLDRLAERPEVKNYFANKALGMTMKYGLAASLDRIHNLFENFQQKHRGYESTHWDRIVFLNTQGEDLVVVESNKQRTWDSKKFLSKEILVQETQIVSMSSRDERTAIISGPVFFKGRHAGQLVAWCSIEGILHKPDIQVANSVKQYWALMGPEQILSLSDQKSPVPLESLHSWVSTHAARSSSNYIHRYDGYIAACAPVKGTPYRFVSVLPSRFVFGNTPPWRFFIGILAIIGLGLLVFMVILRHREQRDHLSKLKESQERLEVALQGGNLGIWDWNVQTGMVNFNDRCKQILGYELQGNEVHINTWNDRIHPEDLPNIPHILENHIQDSNLPYESEHRMRRGDGNWIWVLERGMVLDKDGLGRPLRAAGTLMDITQRKAVEEALTRSEERYRRLVETMNEGFYIIDPEYRFTYVNPQFCYLLQREETDLLHHRLPEFLEQESSDIFMKHFRKRRSSKVENLELVWNRADRSRLFTLISPAPLFNEDGTYKGSFSVVTDITELKNLQIQLLQSQKLEAIGQLAAGIAHEISTPIQYLSNNLQFIKNAQRELFHLGGSDCRPPTDDTGNGFALQCRAQAIRQPVENNPMTSLCTEIHGAVDESLEGLEHIANIVNSIRQLSYPQHETTEDVDVNEVIKYAIVISKNEWKYVAELETDLEPNLPKIVGFSSELNQVFLNIIVNAAHAIGEKISENKDNKGSIFIKTLSHDTCIEVTISDNGIGIPKGYEEKIFEPFFTTKDVGKGTGQGLAIAFRVITEKYGGKIYFESQEHKGTSFFITLPYT